MGDTGKKRFQLCILVDDKSSGLVHSCLSYYLYAGLIQSRMKSFIQETMMLMITMWIDRPKVLNKIDRLYLNSKSSLINKVNINTFSLSVATKQVFLLLSLNSYFN